MSSNQYEITVNNKRRIVHMIVSGELAKDVGEKIITQARIKAAETGYNILCDVRQAKVKADLVDWYYLPRKLEIFQKNWLLRQRY